MQLVAIARPRDEHFPASEGVLAKATNARVVERFPVAKVIVSLQKPELVLRAVCRADHQAANLTRATPSDNRTAARINLRLNPYAAVNKHRLSAKSALSAACPAKILELSAARCAGERNHIANIRNPGNEHQHALESQPETRVRHASVAA